MSQNIQVFVRSRPLSQRELTRGSVLQFSNSQEIKVVDRSNSKTFHFDHIFSENSKQENVFNIVVQPLIEQVLSGFNCTVFAYGQTGTGKTYTMEGERSDDGCAWEEDPHLGIIPRAISLLFDELGKHDNEFTVCVSFLELYNEDTYDLLSPISDTTKLKIFEDAQKKGSVIVGDLEKILVASKAEIYEILRMGSAKRQTAATQLNACSSRSHTIFTVTVHIKESSMEGEELLKIGKLNLVDLAGSENIGRSGAQDKRAREAGNINQSLLTLGRVITALVEKRPHIPYRESKLTRLLQDSLGGKTKTSIIATVSPAAINLEETLSTLDYASRAKKITNKPEMNQRTTKKALIREYQQEIDRLKKDLQATREMNGIYIEEENYKDMCKQLSERNTAIQDKEDHIKALQNEANRARKLDEEYARAKSEIEKVKRRSQLQAAEYKKVIEVTTTDKNLLLDKNERQASIFRENRARIDRFREKHIDDIARPNSIFKMYTEEETQAELTHSGEVTSLIEEFISKFNEEKLLELKRLELALSTQDDLIDSLTKLVYNAQSARSAIVGQIEALRRNATNSPLFKQFETKKQEHLDKKKQRISTYSCMIEREKDETIRSFESFTSSDIQDYIKTGNTPQKSHSILRTNLSWTPCDKITELLDEPNDTSFTMMQGDIEA